MGSDRIQRPAHQRRLLHEHPAVGYGGVYRWEEYGQLGSGPHKVRLCPFFPGAVTVGGCWGEKEEYRWFGGGGLLRGLGENQSRNRKGHKEGG